MPLGLGTALWGAILPVEKTNYCQNPSGEFGTTFWGTSTSGAIGTSSAFQQFGAWSFVCTPDSGLTSGIRGGSVPLTNGDYTASAYVRGAVGVIYNFEIAVWPTGNAQGSTIFTGGGTWQYVTLPYTETSGGGGTIIRAVVVRKRSDASVVPFYVDGVQVEAGSVTTYIDGDQPGGTWLGAPHASPSFRNGQYRGGGSVIALADLGLQVDQMLGVGMPPIEDSTQSYAITDGAQFQRTRAGQRRFTLTGKPIKGTSLADFHITRRTLIDVFKPDLVTPQQPVHFLYVGGQGTIGIDAYYEKGLELGNMQGPIAEDAAISFVATDPYWYAPTQQGTTLGARVALGSVNYMAKRSPLGKWGTLGQTTGTTVQVNVSPSLTAVEDLLINSGGTVIMGGYFGSVAGTVSGPLAQYYPQSNLFGTFTGGTVGFPGAEVTTLALTPSGTLFFAGNFGTVGGTLYPRIGQNVNGAFGTLVGGTLNSNVNKILFNPFGTLFVGGALTLAGGSAARFIAQYANGAWGTINQSAGTLNTNPVAFAWGLDNKSLYVGGNFVQAGGTTATRVAQLVNGLWGTMSTGANGAVYDLVTKQDGRIALGGGQTALGDGTANGIGEWNGVQWQADGLGVQGLVRRVFVRNDNSLIVAGSFQSAGSVSIPDNVAIWNGASYLPLDIDLPFGGNVLAITQSIDNTLYIGGDFFGTAYAASVGTIVNSGRAQVYPSLRLRNLSTGTARAFQLLNTTTGLGIYFNYTMLGGEQADLVLQPGNRSFQSNVRGNIFGQILPGSNLATWALLPGTNYVSFFADNDSLEASFFWTARGWSIDGGTVY